ncbi:MAG TPA: Type 1 glutamine amidotransferase-like domain-containing protein [Longimicrobiaceae bacterium]|nr:Type 1 glutamine amidotransferase-like domain-containing protein [Longimicrobiaceae bacterium]
MQKIYTGNMGIFPDPDLPEEGSLAEGLARPRPDVRPVYLLADSQLLFWSEGGESFLQGVRAQLERPTPRAAYLGASNGDEPEFYEIFVAAMDSVAVFDTRLVPTSPSAEDLAFLEEADLVLLAGGDVERGWRAFEESGVKDAVLRRYYAGATLVGVSAGAVQLGLVGWPEEGPGGTEDLVDTFKIVPYVIDAHAERDEWGHLKRAVRLLGESVQGIGIPAGGGVVYHPDHSLEAVRHPCHEVAVRDGRTVRSLIFPAGSSPETA